MNQNDTDYQVLLFYKYVFLENPNEVRDWLRLLCEKFGLKGRLIVAHEGINITLEGQKDKTEDFISELEKDSRFLNIHYKRSVGDGKSFRKLSVKTRDEIVTTNLGVCDIDPNKITGKRLSPDELHQWFQEGKEFYIVDMRNVYEHNLGHFENSILPKFENFRDLQKITKKLKHLKNKTVLTVCTGGVRCEKASGYLVSQGFGDVYQLDGGIVSYMEKYPNENFLGKLYVFDNRIAMGFYTDDQKHKVIGKCEFTGDASENFVNCANVWCGRHFIVSKSIVDDFKNKNKKITCPNGCKMRHPNKIKSKFGRAVGNFIHLFSK